MLAQKNSYTWVSEKSGYTRPGLVWRRAHNQKDTRISERSGYRVVSVSQRDRKPLWPPDLTDRGVLVSSDIIQRRHVVVDDFTARGFAEAGEIFGQHFVRIGP